MQDRSKPVTGEIYHIFNRGVEKRNIFMDDTDRNRFLSTLYYFNDTLPTNPRIFRSKEVELPTNIDNRGDERLVQIMAFSLMDNHFHLMVKQETENGLTEFMRKVATGYTNYFNLKHQRVGPLFQGLYRRVLAESESQLRYLPYYIHLNPIEITLPKWKERNLTKSEIKIAISNLKKYLWSSHLDYTGCNNFSNIIDKKLITELLGFGKEYETGIVEWLEAEDYMLQVNEFE